MKSIAGAIAALLVAGLAWPCTAAQPADIYGRWATDPADCTDNRYVWVFAEDRAGLVIGNAALGGWRRPVYEPGEGPAIAVVFPGPPRRQIAWRIVKEGEMVAAAHRQDGKAIEQRSFQSWRRCPN
jgi:hypothetical protein